ncbi:MAG: RHS repeat protein [Williamsia sp.]|nr:RHS repeat protein [Williamsia sp.]
MKLLYSLLVMVLLTLNIPAFADTTDCGNNASHGTDNCEKVCSTCPTSGDPFNPYTGNEYREVRDLEVWGTTGEIPLVWMRYSNSRFGSFYKYIYGDGSNWNSSFNYNMTEAGLNDQGRPQFFIHYPQGGGAYFAQSTSNPSLWLPLSAVTEKLFQDGNNFYLQLENGHRYRFQRFALSAGFHYQLQDIRDNYQNIYRLTYDRYGFLSQVTEPAGRYLQIAYREVASGYYLVDRVSTNDGRSVHYNYDVYNDGVASWVRLIGADYGDGTKATYTYSQTEPGSRPSLEHAIDPRYAGTDANMRFVYDTANAWGFVKQEINGVTGAVMATLYSEPGKRTVCYANGRIQTYAMPGELLGMIREYADGLARKTQYTYEEGSADQGGPGLLKTETDALGRTVTYNKRTAYGNLLEITYADGSKQKWTRDELDLTLTHTDELGRVTSYTRDARHRITRIDYPDGTKEKFSYNSFGQVTAHTLRNGAVETTVYDSRGLRTRFIDAEGDLTQYTYDNADRLASVRDARGNTTLSAYDERGLLTKSTNADGSYQTYQYDQFGNQTHTINEIGNTWTMSYDEFKRRDSLKDPLGRLTVYQYNLPGGVCGCSHDNGNPTAMILPSGKLTRMTYDVEWQKTSETAGAGTADSAVTYYEYDVVGNMVTVIDPRMKSWVTAYDERNRKKSFTDPLGHQTKWTYDYAGNITAITRPDGGTTLNQYDEMNRLVQTIDPKAQVTRMKYDDEGNLVKLTDPNDHVYKYDYDLLNRKTSRSYPGGTFERYTYDPAGNLASYTNRAGDVRTYTYDNRNRETRAEWSDNTPAIYKSYDPASRLLGMLSTVSQLTYTYNNANEPTSETQNIAGSPSPRTIRYTYNEDGLKSSLVYPDGNTVRYNYSGRNQLSGIAENGLPAASYSYDANGNRIKKDLYNGTGTVYTYDDANHTLLVDNQKTGASFGRFAYGYDAVDRRTYVKRDNAQGDVYSYDATDQVTGVQYNVMDPGGSSSDPARTVHYDWDATGNRTQVIDNGAPTAYTVNNRNQYTKVEGNPLKYNDNGDLKTFRNATYNYDAQNRLINATDGSQTAKFDYDARNRCVKRTINGTITYLYYDEWDLIDEQRASGLHAVYVHGAQLDEIINRMTGDISTALYYQYDALGNVTHLTDATGNVAEKYTYDVFGAVTIRNSSGSPIAASAAGNRFLFTGREFLQELGLYDFRNRMYSPLLGRFVQPDMMGLVADPVNLYRYVENNPVNWVDPLGLKKCCGLVKKPEYDQSGTIKGNVTFKWSAEFKKDEKHDPKCCEVHQEIKFNKRPNHKGFDTDNKPDTWYEDRTAENARYGHRSNGNKYPTDQYSETGYKGEDQPTPSKGKIWTFRLIVVVMEDCEDAGKIIHYSKELVVEGQ